MKIPTSYFSPKCSTTWDDASLIHHQAPTALYRWSYVDLDDLELDDDSLISFVYCEYSCSSTNRSGVWVVVVDIAIA